MESPGQWRHRKGHRKQGPYDNSHVWPSCDISVIFFLSMLFYFKCVGDSELHHVIPSAQTHDNTRGKWHRPPSDTTEKEQAAGSGLLTRTSWVVVWGVFSWLFNLKAGSPALSPFLWAPFCWCSSGQLLAPARYSLRWHNSSMDSVVSVAFPISDAQQSRRK